MSKLVKGWGGAYVSDQDADEKKFFAETLRLAGGMPREDQIGKALNEFTDQKRSNYATGGEIKIKNPGALHREMDIPEGEKIPMKALRSEMHKADRDDDKKLKQRVNFAMNARGWNKD